MPGTIHYYFQFYQKIDVLNVTTFSTNLKTSDEEIQFYFLYFVFGDYQFRNFINFIIQFYLVYLG